MMLARSSPSYVVYPTLIDVNAKREPSLELLYVLCCLKEIYPRLIMDVQLMINALRNVVVLQEELQISTLHDFCAYMMKCMGVLKKEAVSIMVNSNLSKVEKNINAARYPKPWIQSLFPQKFFFTTPKPETPHEIWFSEKYFE